MERNETGLAVGSRTHFEGGTHQHPHLSGTDFGKQFLFLGVGIRRVDESDFFGRDALGNQFFADVVINIEFSVPFRNRQITENHLCRTLFRRPLPDVVYILHTGIHLAFRFIRQHRIDQSLVKRRLSAFVGDEQHIVLVTGNQSCMDLLGALRKGLHQPFLYLGCGDFDNVVIGFRNGEIQHIRRLNVCHLPEHRHHFGDIREFGKAGLGTIAGAVRCQFNCRHRLPVGRCPCVKMHHILLSKRVILEVALHGIKFNHRVRDRSTRGKYHALTARNLIEIPAFEKEVGGLLRFGL